MKFGEYLIQEGTISQDALTEAIEVQRFRREKLGRLLRDLGHMDQDALNLSVSKFMKLERVHSVQETASELKERIASGELGDSRLKWAAANGVVLFEVKDDLVTLLSDRFQDEVLENTERVFNKRARFLLTDKESLLFIEKSCGLKGFEVENKLRIDAQATDDQKISNVDPYTSLFRDSILRAREMNASDIHIQPSRDGIEIRFRVNGDMFLWKSLTAEHRRSFINEVKRLTNLSIAVSGKAQDGRVSFKSWQLDLRTSLLPSQYGEKIVLRLLDLTRRFDLKALRLNEATEAALLRALKQKNGVIIVSGPTGSGKTTTLYTLLSALDRNRLNIITLEDPIEYGISGLTQVQISPKLSFASALRSVLRQDPDVILVGEIRDAETADLCIKAASTGHLVLSTLHANSAPEVVNRLMNLGVDQFMLKSVLKFSSAQRLVKELCPECAAPLPESEAKDVLSDVKLAGEELDSQTIFKIRNETGCPKCMGGIKGRLPILEYMNESDVQKFLSLPNQDNPQVSETLQSAYLGRAVSGEVDVRGIHEVG